VLQLLPLIERIGGPERVAQLMAHAGLFETPDGTRMIPEADAARLHRQLRLEEPEMAPHLASEAGRRTADYILAHRIPTGAQRLLTFLAAGPAAHLLSRAIARHAWTFAGSGTFRVVTPWQFEIAQNPIVQGEACATCLCHWHAAVFGRLYQILVHPDCTFQEVQCAAQQGQETCRFALSRTAQRAR